MRELIHIEENSVIFEKTKSIFCETPLLGGCKYFDFITESQGFSVREYSSGETIYSRKAFEKSLSVIIDGKATAYKGEVGEEVVVKELVEGDIFGIAALFCDGDEYASEIRVKGKRCIVAFIPQNTMLSLFEKDSSLSVMYIKLLSKKIRYLNNKIDSFISPNAYTKLCKYLYQNGNINIAMQNLAKILDISRMTLYRNIEILEEKGIIERLGKSIKIIKKDELLQKNDLQAEIL